MSDMYRSASDLCNFLDKLKICYVSDHIWAYNEWLEYLDMELILWGESDSSV